MPLEDRDTWLGAALVYTPITTPPPVVNLAALQM